MLSPFSTLLVIFCLGNTTVALIFIGYVDIYSEDGDSRATLDIQRVYTMGSVTGYEFIGGLIGYIEQIDSEPTTLTIKNSFSVAEVSSYANPEYLAGLLGYFDQGDNHLTTSGNYYDQSRTGAASCTGWDGGIDFDCTAINPANDQEDYFYDTANQPLNHWNFTNVWGRDDDVNDGFPCLQLEGSCPAVADGDVDGYDNTIENAAPNDGDANGDGVADAAEGNVTSFVNDLTGNYSVVETSCDNNIGVQLGAESSESKDAAYQYPLGLMGFTGTGCGPNGTTVTVAQYFYGNYSAADYVARKWSNGAYSTITGAEISNVTIDGHIVLKVVYDVVDGGPLDQDGEANGRITDPSGPGQAIIGAPNTGVKQ